MKIFLVLIAIFLRPTSSQPHCQQVTVCNNENITVTIKGEKGDEGMRGKAGPMGLKGDHGLQGESCALGTFPETLMEKISSETFDYWGCYREKIMGTHKLERDTIGGSMHR